MTTRLGISDAEPRALALTPGTVIAERYRIVSELGSGAMGAVFLAEHTTLGRRVALKTIHRELLGSAEAVARFEREALASARLDHPNVVAATDVVALADGSPVLVLEYVQGRSLAKRLAEDGPLPTPVAVALLSELAGALVVAHAAGIVHRDLKPENLLLVERPGLPLSIKILDFGIAKLIGDASHAVSAHAPGTQLGLVYGTPRYMAPEQALGQAVDARVDLYAVGVIAYELFAGRVPFDGPDLASIVTRQLTEAPPPFLPEGPPALSRLVLELLAPTPETRISSALELRARLDAASRLAAGPSMPAAGAPRSPTSSAPPSPAGRVAAVLDASPPWKVAAVLAAVGCVALAAGGLFFSAPPRRAPPATVASEPTPESKPGADELDRAKVAGRSALESLAFRYPRDAAIAQALVESAHAEGASLLVAKHLAHLATLEPSRAEALAPLAEAHATRNADAAAALVPLLAASLGAQGLEALVSLAEKKGPAKKAAQGVLASETLRAKLTPASRVLLDSRGARSCQEKKGLLPRMKADGDARLAPVVAAWSSMTGCGFLTLADCNPCLRSREPAATLLELRTRFAEGDTK